MSFGIARSTGENYPCPRGLLPLGKVYLTINELYAKHTGQPVDKIKHDIERDNFMSAADAKDYGLIDEVLTNGKRPE